MRRTSEYRLDLPRYMAICDANYIRLLKLLPDLESVGSDWDRVFSIDRTIVHIRVLEQFRYTQTLEIAASPDISSLVAAPVMLIRVYHDAATAEVVRYQRQGSFEPRYELDNNKQYQQDEKQQVNQFLGEWLNLCISSGVSLQSAVSCSA